MFFYHLHLNGFCTELWLVSLQGACFCMWTQVGKGLHKVCIQVYAKVIGVLQFLTSKLHTSLETSVRATFFTKKNVFATADNKGKDQGKWAEQTCLCRDKKNTIFKLWHCNFQGFTRWLFAWVEGNTILDTWFGVFSLTVGHKLSLKDAILYWIFQKIFNL